MFEAILQTIQAYDTIIIHRHNRPDGDAMGSQLGLKHLILENYPQKTVYVVGDAPGYFGFMEDAVMDEIPDSAYSGALACILDSAAPHLISDDRYTLAEKAIRIDHHIFCQQIADGARPYDQNLFCLQFRNGVKKPLVELPALGFGIDV